MYCCVPTNPERDNSKKIDQQIKDTRTSNEVKLLLLGAGESGKSTFAKQMKILHMNGWDDNERGKYRDVVHHNIVDAMAEIITACGRMGIELEEKNKERALKMIENDYCMEFIDQDIAQDLTSMWSDSGVQKGVGRAHEFQYFDSMGYFMQNLSRVADPNYMPTNTDILYSRSTTCGIIETTFRVSSLHFRMCDVAGQRSERRKWMHCFSDARAVLVIVGLSEYDQVLAEQNEVNRMQEALKLFGDICNSRWFEKTTMILFLNKMDLFAEKIKRVPLRTCFPEYTGPDTFEMATQFIARKFVAANKSPSKHVYTHLTCATDTECVKYIFNSVMDAIINERIAYAE